MSSKQTSVPQAQFSSDMFGIFGPAMDYAIDAAQRSVLFWDVMRQRGNSYREHEAKTVPHVLRYQFELVIDGRTLERPVNYGLVRIVPPEGVTIDPKLRPFVIVDPRAGHGPGHWRLQGGQRDRRRAQSGTPLLLRRLSPRTHAGADDRGHRPRRSRVPREGYRAAPRRRGQAMRDRQLPSRLGGDDARLDLAPTCSGRSSSPARRSPIGPASADSIRCATTAACSAEAGSPRLRATSDTGSSTARGSCRISRTSTRQIHSGKSPTISLPKVDTEAPRYLEFERWWGGHVNLTAEEMQFIVDELFVGNKLAAGLIKSSDGTAIDLAQYPLADRGVLLEGRQYHAPPAGAGLDSRPLRRCRRDPLLWSDDRLFVHESVGHLGIFVSGGVARKEHGEFASNIDLIDVLPPGLYEAVFEAKSADTANPEPVPRRMGHALRGADARRHPRAWWQ